MSVPFSMGRFSDLVGLVYDAALDPGCWPIAINEIRIALGFKIASLNLQALPSGQVLLNLTSNIPPDYAERMVRYGAESVDLWGGAHAFRALPMMEEPAVLSKINPEAIQFDTTKNRYSLEFVKPQGLTDVMVVSLARDKRALGCLAFGRHESDGPIGENDIKLARLLMPHLQRADTINRLLNMAVAAGSAFEAAIDSLAAPVFLTTADLSVLYANRAGHEVIAKDDLLSVRGGVLAASSAAVLSALKVAVVQAVSDESKIGRKGLGIPVRFKDGSVAALHVLPLRQGRISLKEGAIAAIFVSQGVSRVVAPAKLITSLFGLTPAEARVFEQLAAGSTIVDVAADLNVKQSTVRTHLLRLFEKTETRRQAELIHLGASLTGPFA